MAAFVPEALSYEQDYPIACVKIQPLNRKFSEDLTHRDYLGAILNLGSTGPRSAIFFWIRRPVCILSGIYG